MLDSGFVDFNSPESTPSGYETQVSKSASAPVAIDEDFTIDLQDFSLSTQVRYTVYPDATDDEVRVEKICGDRMRLLARTYSEEKASDHQKEMLARIEMIEEELENSVPRYGEAEWKLLESFKAAIDAL